MQRTLRDLCGDGYRTEETHRSHIPLKTGKSNMLEQAELEGEMGAQKAAGNLNSDPAPDTSFLVSIPPKCHHLGGRTNCA